MWPKLLDEYGLRIEFAYTTFKWDSEAAGMAHVHVVIIGLGRGSGEQRRLFHVDDTGVLEENPKTISPYLFGTNVAHVVHEASKPLNGLPQMRMGSKPIDGGHYIFTDEEKKEFLRVEPAAAPYIRPYMDAKGFLHGKRR